MAEKRKPLSKKIRFEVFKRDNFTCQYCGRSAPDVVLEVDHINPVKNGGTNDILNLITSCHDCNNGKRATPLSDHQAISKQVDEMKILNERREQLDMLLKWRKELSNLENDEISAAEEEFKSYTGYGLSEHGRVDIGKYIKRYGMNLILESIQISAQNYFKSEDKDSANNTFNMIPRIATMRLKDKEEPYLKDLYYCRGILRNRLDYIDESKAITYLREAVKLGVQTDELKELCKEVKDWADFKNALFEIYGVVV